MIAAILEILAEGSVQIGAHGILGGSRRLILGALSLMFVVGIVLVYLVYGS